MSITFKGKYFTLNFNAFNRLLCYTVCGDYMENRTINDINYTLARKRVKNINIRINNEGMVMVSAPKFVSAFEIDQIILKRQQWIIDAKYAKAQKQQDALQPPAFSKNDCLHQFNDIADKIFPLFAQILNGEKPIIKVRNMKTRWGVCHIQKRTIVLNMRLMEKPVEAQEYVIMHEFVHFLHADHQKGFYNALTTLMPDYKLRRKLLK